MGERMGGWMSGVISSWTASPGQVWPGHYQGRRKAAAAMPEPALLWPIHPCLAFPCCQCPWRGGIYSSSSSCGPTGPHGRDAVAQRRGHHHRRQGSLRGCMNWKWPLGPAAGRDPSWAAQTLHPQCPQAPRSRQPSAIAACGAVAGLPTDAAPGCHEPRCGTREVWDHFLSWP